MRYVAAVLILAVVFSLNWVVYHIPGEGRAVNAAENLGMRNAHVIKRSYSWGVFGGCHENDVTKFTVQGDTDNGTRTIQVCAPILGGYTVRS